MGILQISWAHTGNNVNSTDSRRKRWNPWISSDFGKSDWPSWKSDKMPEMWRITRNPIAQPPDGPPRLQNAAESASEAGEAAHQGSPQQRRATPTGATAEHKQNVVFPWYFGSMGAMARDFMAFCGIPLRSSRFCESEWNSFGIKVIPQNPIETRGMAHF